MVVWIVTVLVFSSSDSDSFGSTTIVFSFGTTTSGSTTFFFGTYGVLFFGTYGVYFFGTYRLEGLDFGV